MKTKYRILLWDMDGTIMDSQEGLIQSIDYTFAQCGLPRETTETYRSYLGPSLKHTFRTHYHLSDEKADAAIQVFRAWFHDHGMLKGNHMFPGIRELLADLKAAGYRMAIATSKLEEFALEIADHFDLTPYFEHICGSDREGLRPEKPEVIAWTLRQFPDFDPAEVLMIGDRNMDVLGARENGIDVAAVLYGYGSREETADADWQLSSVEELRAFLL